MATTVKQALSAISDLGTVEQMQTLAAEGCRPKVRPKVNIHIHLPPNFSAFETVEQAVGLAAEQGIAVLGVSNYYDYRVYGDYVAHARKRGIFPLFGLEIISLVDELVRQRVKINDPGNPGRMYICGKGITRFAPMSDKALEIVEIIRRNDRQRMSEMIEKLLVIFKARGLDTELTEEKIIDGVVERHRCPRDAVYLQERHVAQAFQQAVFARTSLAERIYVLSKILGAQCTAEPTDAVKIQGEIRTHLMKAGKAAFVEEKFVTYEQALTLILELGGIPCYPTLADGASPICPYEQTPEKLIANCKERNFHCVELIPIRNSPAVLDRYVRAYRKAGITVTAGTEHNTLDMLPLEPACKDGEEISNELKEIFWEGACVVAAHQFLNLHGRCGFVDGRGQPNKDYPTAEERIRAFSALGAALIRTYYDQRPPAAEQPRKR
ncbi:MAG: hypothetical protein ACYTF6_07495 [Planctomycetota bacterium]|jgi:hypothetical protein